MHLGVFFGVKEKEAYFSGQVLRTSINPRSAMPLATEGTQEPFLHKKGLRTFSQTLFQSFLRLAMLI